MRKTALGAIFLTLFATAAVAQEAQQEPMFVSVTHVSVKPEMMSAFMAAIADHLEWHKSINDTHYYGVSQAMTGPRTGQMVFVAGPMTGAQLDDYDAFSQQDMADIAARGTFSYVDSIETVIMQTMPGLGSPPPAGTSTRMAHVYELQIDHSKLDSFSQALNKMDEVQKAAGPEDGYSAWLMPTSGTSFATRWFVAWTDSWSEMGGEDAERQAKVAEAAGGEEAFQKIVGDLMGAIVGSSSTTYMSMPQLSFQPPGR